jgi:hypothetical protein
MSVNRKVTVPVGNLECAAFDDIAEEATLTRRKRILRAARRLRKTSVDRRLDQGVRSS